MQIPFTKKPDNLIEQASHSADQAIRATQQAAIGAVDTAADSLQNLRQQTTPMVARASDRVTSLAQRGIDNVRDTSNQVRLQVEQASDCTVSYIREKPVKAVLMAAATGAALMALASLVARSRDRN